VGSSLCFSAGPPLSSACLDATTIPHASGAWSRIFHLMHGLCLGSLPWPLCLACAACVAAALSRLPCVLCPWCLGCPACWCPGRCTVWVGCVPGVLASWPALCGWAVCAPVHGPALWAVWLGLIFRPFIAAFLEGLLKKAFIFALYFSGIFSLDFSPLCAGLYFFWFIFPASRSRIFFSGFFCVEISGEFFRIYFSGFFLALFSRRYLASSFFSI
jgi:hypothetical protein